MMNDADMIHNSFISMSHYDGDTKLGSLRNEDDDGYEDFI